VRRDDPPANGETEPHPGGRAGRGGAVELLDLVGRVPKGMLMTPVIRSGKPIAGRAGSREPRSNAATIRTLPNISNKDIMTGSIMSDAGTTFRSGILARYRGRVRVRDRAETMDRPSGKEVLMIGLTWLFEDRRYSPRT
jgi:hypothetical protein